MSKTNAKAFVFVLHFVRRAGFESKRGVSRSVERVALAGPRGELLRRKQDELLGQILLGHIVAGFEAQLSEK